MKTPLNLYKCAGQARAGASAEAQQEAEQRLAGAEQQIRESAADAGNRAERSWL